jgi:hypothetical protein
MTRLLGVAIVSLGVLSFSIPVSAHELVDSNGKLIATHQHVWRQQSYGQDYRQGHSVNNSLGSITIWSPNTYNPYKAGSGVRFARPPLNTVKPKAGSNIPQVKTPSQTRYDSGKK